MNNKNNSEEIRTPKYNLLLGRRIFVDGQNVLEVARGSRKENILIKDLIKMLG